MKFNVLNSVNRALPLNRGLVWLLSVFLLAACATHQSPPTTQQALIQKLQSEDVGVTTVGQSVAIVLPSDTLFNPSSANINPKYQPILMQIADLLKTYQLVSVQVAGYSNLEVPDVKALTEKQAQVIATALWDRGIDSRLVYAVGYANLYPVAPSSNPANRRIQISFRFYPVVSYYD